MSHWSRPGCSSIHDSAVVPVWGTQKYYFNKYLIKKVVLLIHYAEHNAYVYITPSASAGAE